MAEKKKKRVMLVDDHIMVRDAIKALIEADKDFQVVATSSTGAGVIDLAKKHNVDLVLMDIELPDASGLNVARDLLIEYPKAKVIFLTMHRHEEYALRGLRIGAQGYLLKNSDSSELLAALKEISAGRTYITRDISDRIARHVARNNGQQVYRNLSDREFQVLRGLAMGKSCKELAEEFGLSVKTIYTYRTRLLEKLELKSDIDLLRYVLRHKLLAGEDVPLYLGEDDDE